MIILGLSGGLGNQMFQYALGLKLENLGKHVKYDLSFFNQRRQALRKYELYDAFNIKCAEASEKELRRIGKGNHLLGKIEQKLGYNSSKITKEDLDIGFFSKILEMDNVYLEGYWQSEKYFFDIRTEICERYHFRDEKGETVKSLFDQIVNTNSVSVHIRRGDYLTEQNEKIYGGICTVRYYQQAIAYIKSKMADPTFYLFSNDLEWVKENLYEPDMVLVDYDTNGKDYYDMYLMSGCKANIIANSSFSWWGAWLNQNQGKIVISPNKWFNNHQNADMICADWVKMPG